MLSWRECTQRSRAVDRRGASTVQLDIGLDRMLYFQSFIDEED